MLQVLHNNGVTVVIDPLNVSQQPPEQLRRHCGIIPSFIQMDEFTPMYEQACNRYGFYTGDSTGYTVTEDNVLQYPGDIDMYPLMLIERQLNNKVDRFCIYPYGIVMGMYETPTKKMVRITRMD